MFFNRPKKLKKIPYDLVPYIQIETEAIKTKDDKMIIASYCQSKLELVEWYLALVEAGSEKYMVPHREADLIEIRDQLKACYKNIMAVKIKKTQGQSTPREKRS